MKKLLLVGLFAVGTVSTVVLFFSGTSHKKQHPFITATPERRDIAQYVEATGPLSAKDEITVGSLVAGRVIELHADDNDVVKKGQLLLLLDDGVGDSAVKKTKGVLDEQVANLTYGEKFFVRQEGLYNTGQLAENLYDQEVRNLEVLKAKVAQTRADLEIQQKTFHNLSVKAPSSGVVTSRKVDLGQMVTAQFQATALFTIAQDLKKLEGKINVDEADIGMVKKGQLAEFTVDAYPKRIYTATVDRIEYFAKIIDNVVTFAAVLEITNDDLSLRPGMTANVSLKVAEASQAISVPNKALRINLLGLEEIAKKINYTVVKQPAKSTNKTGKKTTDFLWVVEGTQFRQVPVKLGVSDRRFTQIIKGITDKSMVLIEIINTAQESAFLKQAFGGGGIGK